MLKYKTEDLIEESGLSFHEKLSGLQELTQDITSELITLREPIDVSFDISIGTKELLLLGQIRGAFELTCSRCLKRFESTFNQDLEQTFERELDEIDVGEEVRQGIVLAIPEKPLCQPHCKGLCPQCGANLNDSQCACKVQNAGLFDRLKEIRFKG